MDRRLFLGSSLSAGVASLLPLRAFARSLPATPSETEGPFYPVYPIPLASNLLKTKTNKALLGFSGRVVNTSNQPIAGAKVEIWQCDYNGVYNHPDDNYDNTFEQQVFSGAGARLTDSNGGFYFQTLLPVPYTGRPPHIHAKVFVGGRHVLTTQIYMKGQATERGYMPSHRRQLLIEPVRKAGNVYAANFTFVV